MKAWAHAMHQLRRLVTGKGLRAPMLLRGRCRSSFTPVGGFISAPEVAMALTGGISSQRLADRSADPKSSHAQRYRRHESWEPIDAPVLWSQETINEAAEPGPGDHLHHPLAASWSGGTDGYLSEQFRWTRARVIQEA